MILLGKIGDSEHFLTFSVPLEEARTAEDAIRAAGFNQVDARWHRPTSTVRLIVTADYRFHFQAKLIHALRSQHLLESQN